MEVSDLFVRLIILLFPGFVSMVIIKSLISKRKIDNREYFIYVMLLGFVNYFILFIIYKIIFKDNIIFFSALLDSEVKIDFKEVFGSSIIAVISAIIGSQFINRGWYYNICRFIGFTNRTGSVSVWSDLLDNNSKGISRFIYVVDEMNDLVYGGQVRDYSNTDEKDIELVLLNVIVTKNSCRSEIIREMDYIYLNFPKEKIVIEVGDEIDGKQHTKKR